MSLRRALPAAVLVVAALCVAWTSLIDYLWSDYENEVEGPIGELVAGNVGAFVTHAPAYGGSLIMRAPFALVASWLGGGDIAIWRALTAPCLIAAVVLGVVLMNLRRELHPKAGWLIVFGLIAAANPLTLRALEIGHPEDLLGAVLCVGAVLAAVRDRPWVAALLLGLALGNKAWGVLAIGPVLLALRERRMLVLCAALALGGALTAPFLLWQGTGHVATATGTTTSVIFQPWQVWWVLGETGNAVYGSDGVLKPGYRTPPEWLSPITHPLIAFLVVPLSLLFAWRRGRAGDATAREDVLALLALLFLLRCVLDPWNFNYYHLPFVLALLAWETLRFSRPPVLALGASFALWLTWQKLRFAVPPDTQFALYVIPALAMCGWLARQALSARVQHEREPERVAPAGHQVAVARP